MIFLGADKHGYKAMQIVLDFLSGRGIASENLGVKKESEDMKLEDLIPRVVSKVLSGKGNQGILSCGTGVGVAVGANKFKGIRACLATNRKVAEWSRVYDDCNVLCLAGWDCTKENIEDILGAWLKAEYDGDKGRLEMFKAFDAFGKLEGFPINGLREKVDRVV